MKKCTRYEGWMTDALFDELDVSKQSQLDEHLSKCRDCATVYESLKGTLDHMGQYARPEPDDEYFKAYWNKLESKLDTPVRQSIGYRLFDFLSVFPVPKLAFGAACILFVGIFIGRTFFREPAVIPFVEHYNAPSAQLIHDTGQYLERSKLILLGFVNTDSEDAELLSDDLSRQKRISGQLVSQSASLKTALSDSKQHLLLELVEELELILMQIANLETESDMDGVELIRSGAEKNAILFKINLGEMQLSRPQQSEQKQDTQTI